MKYAGRYASLLLLLLSILVAASSPALAQIGPDIPRKRPHCGYPYRAVPNPRRFNAWAPGTTTDAGIQQLMLDTPGVSSMPRVKS